MTSPEALPAGSPDPFMGSIEPLVSLPGAGGASYFTGLVAPTLQTYAPTGILIWYSVACLSSRP